jgi:hypothetical protein
MVCSSVKSKFIGSLSSFLKINTWYFNALRHCPGCFRRGCEAAFLASEAKPALAPRLSLTGGVREVQVSPRTNDYPQ